MLNKAGGTSILTEEPRFSVFLYPPLPLLSLSTVPDGWGRCPRLMQDERHPPPLPILMRFGAAKRNLPLFLAERENRADWLGSAAKLRLGEGQDASAKFRSKGPPSPQAENRKTTSLSPSFQSHCTAFSNKLLHPISDIEPRLAVLLGIFYQALSSSPGVRSGIADGIE
ncbi:hypothetical protein SRHO_G00124490 [Serrasalmus rhombeus]